MSHHRHRFRSRQWLQHLRGLLHRGHRRQLGTRLGLGPSELLAQDLGGLSGPGQVAREQVVHLGDQPGEPFRALAEPLGALWSQRPYPVVRPPVPVPSLRDAVADQKELHAETGLARSELREALGSGLAKLRLSLA